MVDNFIVQFSYDFSLSSLLSSDIPRIVVTYVFFRVMIFVIFLCSEPYSLEISLRIHRLTPYPSVGGTGKQPR